MDHTLNTEYIISDSGNGGGGQPVGCSPSLCREVSSNCDINCKMWHGNRGRVWVGRGGVGKGTGGWLVVGTASDTRVDLDGGLWSRV